MELESVGIGVSQAKSGPVDMLEPRKRVFRVEYNSEGVDEVDLYGEDMSNLYLDGSLAGIRSRSFTWLCSCRCGLPVYSRNTRVRS